MRGFPSSSTRLSGSRSPVFTISSSPTGTNPPAGACRKEGSTPFVLDHLYAAERFGEHARPLEMKGPSVIIEGSGMCTGGRIINHLKTWMKVHRNYIVFVWYQAEETPGREILEHGNQGDAYVHPDGGKIPIRAGVHSLSGYSAHADQKGLIEWVKAMGAGPKRIKLVYGEPAAQKCLAEKLQALGYTVM